ncbi:MAG: MarR family transcriptional regulator, partial [Bryobacteraceae bacterium]
LTERSHLHVIKVGLIFAVLNGHQQIEYEDITRAILVADFSRQVAVSLAPELGLSRTGKLEARILYQLRTKGPSSQRDLCRSLNVCAEEINRAVGALQKAEMVRLEEVSNRRLIKLAS